MSRRAWSAERVAKALATPETWRFDASTHEYFLNGVKVPSITQMLDNVGLIDDSYYTAECAERGTMVHKLTAQFDLGSLNHPQQVECIWKGYLLAHVAAMQTLRPEILSVEIARVSSAYRFGGRPDRIWRLWRAVGTCDLKTGAVADWHGVQTSLQAILVAPEFNLPPTTFRRHGLYLRDNGRWRLIEHTDRRDFDKAYDVIATCCKAA